MSRIYVLSVLIFHIGMTPVHAATTDLVGAGAWSTLLQGIQYDGVSDTQANKAGTEIVGDATHPSMYVNYDDNGTTTGVDPELDDILSFRIRIGDETKATHSSYVFIGIEVSGDGIGDGIMDAFISSGADKTQLWDAGTDSNTSPSTTDLSNTAYVTYTQDATNYNFATVSAANDPDWDGTTDIGLDGRADVFVSFSILVSDLDAFLAEPAQGITFTPATQLRFVSLTSTQTNSLNSDFNGIGNSATDDWGQTYASLGILSDPVASTGVVDATAPAAPTVIPLTTNSTTPTLSGTFDSADAAGGFTLNVGGVTYTLGVDAALTAVGDSWSLDIPAGNALASGTYEVTATATDGAGNAATDTSSNELVIDATAPTAPTVIPLTTNSTTPTLSGAFDSADATGGFTLNVDGVTYTLGVDVALTAVGDSWSLDIPAGNALASGTYEVTATATDGAGNAATDTSSNELVIDASPPTAPTVTALTGNDTTPTLSGTFDSADATGGFTLNVGGVTYTLGVDAALTAVGDSWGLAIPAGNALTSGTYEVTATATDGAGNAATDTSSNELVIDASPPTAPTVSPLSTNSTTPTLSGTFDSADAAGGFTLNVDGETYTLGVDAALSAVGDSWSLDIPAGNALASGTYEVTATATDGAGNAATDTSSNELVIDATAPAAPTVIPLTTNSTTPTLSGAFDSADAAGGFTLNVDGVTYTLGVDAALTAVGDSWSLDIPAGNALTSGTYEVTATATDGAGNAATDTSSNELVINPSGPMAPTVNAISTNSMTPTLIGTFDNADAAGGFTLNVDGVTYTLGVDAALTAVGDSWSLDIPAGNALASGTYEVTATATDGAGNAATDTSSNELVIDATAPTAPTVIPLTTNSTTPILSGTFDSADAAGGFTLNVDGVTYTLGVDAALSAVGDSWSLGIPAGNALASGTYEVTATATDGAGNAATDSSSNELAIDTDDDGDGLTNSLDLDDDNDGIPDSLEGDGTVDTDLDGVPDSQDLDSDNDGLFDLVESGVVLLNPDVDNNGRIDAAYTVSVNGLADAVETTVDSGAIKYIFSDSDSDGVHDFRDLDSDNDGLPDLIESGGNDPDTDGIPGSGVPVVDASGIPAGGGLAAVDADGDGTGNFRDLDSDADGISDLEEANGTDTNNDGRIDGFTDLNGDGLDDGIAASPLTAPDDDGDGTPDYLDNDDTDGDGVPDSRDMDDDNDAIPDALEGDGILDTDLDGVPDSLDLDADNDGLHDLVESGIATIGLDLNGDGRIDTANPFGSNGLVNVAETTAGSGVINYIRADSDMDSVPDSRDRDSDNDGMFDAIEANGSDPDNDGVIGTGNPAVDVNGLSVLSGLSAIDTDSDLVPDFRDLDSDNDGLYDVVESAGNDADNDGVPGIGTPFVDTLGVTAGAGLIPVDTDGDSILDYRDRDSDNDGLTDTVETGGSDPDGDGIPGTAAPVVDAQGTPVGGGLMPTDSDNDGSIDTLDLDSDADGIPDLVEAGGTDIDNNGIFDGFTDANGDGYDDGLAVTALLPQDTDADGIPDHRDNDDNDNDGIADSVDLDDDNDAIPDALEGDAAVDTDADGIPDSRDLDSDNDGLTDLAESGADAVMLDADNDGQVDILVPPGANGLADSVETLPDSGLIAYNGGMLIDSDSDGVEDFRDPDSDNDGIFDVVESGGSDPDMDGVTGSGDPAVNTKGMAGTLVPVDSDNDGIPNHRDGDSDNDGIPDTAEAGVHDPELDGVAGTGTPATDSSGATPGGGVNPPDTDNDGIPDQLDLDSDNDGIFDLVEAGGDDVDNNGQVDGLIDTNADGLDDGLAAVPLPNLLQNPIIIETGLNGSGGCTLQRVAPVDPTLPLLAACALLGLRSRRIAHQDKRN